MAKSLKIEVRFTKNFEANLKNIEAFWAEHESPSYPNASFDQLLDELADKVIANLERHPRMRRSFLSGKAESVEAIARLMKLQARLRQYAGNAATEY